MKKVKVRKKATVRKNTGKKIKVQKKKSPKPKKRGTMYA